MDRPLVLPGSVPLWAEFPAIRSLLGPPRAAVRENDLRDRYPEVRGPDHRGVLSWPEARMVEDAPWAVGWLADVLGLRACDNWPRLAKLLGSVTRQFFGHRPHAPAFLFAESCRDRVPLQRPGLAQRGAGVSARRRAPAGRRVRPFRLPLVGVDLPADLVAFACHRELVAGPGARVVRSAFEREFTVGRALLCGLFSGWCAADLALDRADLLVGRTPAGRLSDLGDRVNVSRLACWVRVVDETGGWIETLTLDVHPGTGALVSVRENHIPARMLLEMHPRWHGWLRTLYAGDR